MPQTDGHMTSKHSTLEVSSDQVSAVGNVTTWTDISGSSNALTPSGGDHMTGYTHSFGEFHDPLTGIGKVEPASVVARAIYTEEDEESTDLFQGFYENETRIWMRYRPAGAGAGNWEYIFHGHVVGPCIPSSDATTADILLVEATLWGVYKGRLGQGTT
ncbi:MAG TPA: hypothetical protein VMW24_24785 [Sedimentisphaerales bacterium]|nr:hypothetical protein [Sedimentisphaerales bacterium]